jgi:hypothetical protein
MHTGPKVAVPRLGSCSGVEDIAFAPLLDVMVSDWPGLAFMSGLAAFETRAVFSTAGARALQSRAVPFRHVKCDF